MIILIFLLSKTNIIIRLIVHINIVEINEDDKQMTISLCICVCMYVLYVCMKERDSV